MVKTNQNLKTLVHVFDSLTSDCTLVVRNKDAMRTGKFIPGFWKKMLLIMTAGLKPNFQA